MIDAHTLTHNLGGHWKNGRGQAPCPICQPERRRDQIALSVSEQGGKLLLYCFKSHCPFAATGPNCTDSITKIRLDLMKMNTEPTFLSPPPPVLAMSCIIGPQFGGY
jgi:hypothetical protein